MKIFTNLFYYIYNVLTFRHNSLPPYIRMTYIYLSLGLYLPSCLLERNHASFPTFVFWNSGVSGFFLDWEWMVLILSVLLTSNVEPHCWFPLSSMLSLSHHETSRSSEWHKQFLNKFRHACMCACTYHHLTDSVYLKTDWLVIVIKHAVDKYINLCLKLDLCKQ